MTTTSQDSTHERPTQTTKRCWNDSAIMCHPNHCRCCLEPRTSGPCGSAIYGDPLNQHMVVTPILSTGNCWRHTPKISCPIQDDPGLRSWHFAWVLASFAQVDWVKNHAFHALKCCNEVLLDKQSLRMLLLRSSCLVLQFMWLVWCDFST